MERVAGCEFDHRSCTGTSDSESSPRSSVSERTHPASRMAAAAADASAPYNLEVTSLSWPRASRTSSSDAASALLTPLSWLSDGASCSTVAESSMPSAAAPGNMNADSALISSTGVPWKFQRKFKQEI